MPDAMNWGSYSTGPSCAVEVVVVGEKQRGGSRYRDVLDVVEMRLRKAMRRRGVKGEQNYFCSALAVAFDYPCS